LQLFIYCALTLILATTAASAIGYAPTQARWGADGVHSMLAVAAICLGVAVIGIVPMAIIAPRWPQHIGQAVLAGTAIRLLLTMGAIVAYQVAADPQLGPFLFWATVFYLMLLSTESVFGVIAVRRFFRPPASGTGGAVS
jgi:hypothetical protein